MSTVQSINFTVAGAPTAKGRPRFSRKSGRAYTPAKTQQAEDTFAARAAVELAPWRSHLPLRGPLRVMLHFAMPIPASWSKKKREGAKWHTSRPDLDNLAKLVKDALNGIAWIDDAQVIALTCTKSYCETPGVDVYLDEVTT